MAYKTFVAGEEALAADVNNYLMSQTVSRFASAAARTSGLTAPVVNQLSMLDTRAGILQYWNGSAWTDAIPFFQTAVGALALDANGYGSFAFPVPFVARPFLTALPQATPGQHLAWTVTVADTTSATLAGLIVTNSDSLAVTGSITVSWAAWGFKP